MKWPRKKTWCNDCRFLDHENKRCSIGIKTEVVKRLGHHVTIRVVDHDGCRAARVNRL